MTEDTIIDMLFLCNMCSLSTCVMDNMCSEYKSLKPAPIGKARRGFQPLVSDLKAFRSEQRSGRKEEKYTLRSYECGRISCSAVR